AAPAAAGAKEPAERAPRPERKRPERPAAAEGERAGRGRGEPRAAPAAREERDLGPSVRGFGDAVPAFMTIPIPRPRRGAVESPEAEAA
ncbi:hypothetical protein K1J50_10705, partial [Caldovatus sp. SYSU G05006]|nr:hypothetical protein [Caldovatus aquaticus]